MTMILEAKAKNRKGRAKESAAIIRQGKAKERATIVQKAKGRDKTNQKAKEAREAKERVMANQRVMYQKENIKATKYPMIGTTLMIDGIILMMKLIMDKVVHLRNLQRTLTLTMLQPS